MKKAELKVKIKSLAEEARIIRREEHRAKDDDVRERLYAHRVCIVRVESRASLLLYAYSKYIHEQKSGRDPRRWLVSRIESPSTDRDCYWRRRAVKRAREMGKRFYVDMTHFDWWIQN